MARLQEHAVIVVLLGVLYTTIKHSLHRIDEGHVAVYYRVISETRIPSIK